MGLLDLWPLSLCFPRRAPAQSGPPPPGAPEEHDKQEPSPVRVVADAPLTAPSPITRDPFALASHPLPDLAGSHLPTPDTSFTSVAGVPMAAAGVDAGAAAVAAGKAHLVPEIGWNAKSAPARPLLDSANQANGAAGAGPVCLTPVCFSMTRSSKSAFQMQQDSGENISRRGSKCLQ